MKEAAPAGHVGDGHGPAVAPARFADVYDINVKSIFHMIHAVVPMMRRARRGVILNVGSTVGIRPRPGLTWYNSSKGAVNLMSKSLAVELGSDNIRVNVICPVMGVTALLESFMGMPDTPENRKKFVATIPLGRLSTPMDVAKAAVFLASDDGRVHHRRRVPGGRRPHGLTVLGGAARRGRRRPAEAHAVTVRAARGLP